MKQVNSNQKLKPETKFWQWQAQFKTEFFHFHEKAISLQQLYKGDVVYFPLKGKITQERLIEHFYGKSASLGVQSTSSDNKLKWVCFDFDEKEHTQKAEKVLIPKLKELGIEYLIELGGDHFERMHLWIKVTSSQKIAEKFFIQMVSNIGGYSNYSEFLKDKTWKEIFGVNKPNFLIRVPLGFHLKRGKVFPFVRKNGMMSVSPGEFMEDFCKLIPLTEERMLELIGQFPSLDKDEIKRTAPKTFIYTPRTDLTCPVTVPIGLKPIVCNCQAINQVLSDVVNNEMINKPGEVHHSAGLFLHGIAKWHDITFSKNKPINDGKKWISWIVNNYRLRDASSHAWDHSEEKNANRYFAKCEVWEEKFGYCEGCPFMGRVTNPKHFAFGAKAKDKKVRKQVILKDFQEIRSTTFVEFAERIKSDLSSRV